MVSYTRCVRMHDGISNTEDVKLHVVKDVAVQNEDFRKFF